MARTPDANQHFGLEYIGGAGGTVSSTPKKPAAKKGERPMKKQNISAEAANAQRWNTTNRTRSQGGM